MQLIFSSKAYVAPTRFVHLLGKVQVLLGKVQVFHNVQKSLLHNHSTLFAPNTRQN